MNSIETLVKLSDSYVKRPCEELENRIVHLVENEMSNEGFKVFVWHTQRLQNTIKSLKILLFICPILFMNLWGVSLFFSTLISVPLYLVFRDYLVVFAATIYQTKVIEKNVFAVYWSIKAEHFYKKNKL